MTISLPFGYVFYYREFDLSICRIQERWPDGRSKLEVAVIDLRCHFCGKLTKGCKDHKYCGMCEPCRQALEGD